MAILSEDSAVILKTRDLCQAILDQPEFQEIRERIIAFQMDDAAQAQYQSLSDKQGALQRKQEQGQELTDQDIDGFERDRDAFMRNPVASGFIDAQQQLHEVKQTITKLVTRTFELGRVPSPDELKSGPCGQGCSCH
jgi:cell fate (sporulation/competence/biofilm development) regulator YlbF (YheA/YmcA/DUF963 family)